MHTHTKVAHFLGGGCSELEFVVEITPGTAPSAPAASSSSSSSSSSAGAKKEAATESVIRKASPHADVHKVTNDIVKDFFARLYKELEGNKEALEAVQQKEQGLTESFSHSVETYVVVVIIIIVSLPHNHLKLTDFLFFSFLFYVDVGLLAAAQHALPDEERRLHVRLHRSRAEEQLAPLPFVQTRNAFANQRRHRRK